MADQKKIQNDYSTSAVLVVDDNSYYKYANAGYTLTSPYFDKIIMSDTEGASPSKLDPFRQAIGKLWTFVPTAIAAAGDVTFYDPYAAGPGTVDFGAIGTKGNIQISENYQEKAGIQALYGTQFHDVTKLWEDLFPKGSYGDLDLKRKATRIEIRFDSSDVLESNLAFVSLITNINRKNNGPSFEVTGNDAAILLQLNQEYQELLVELAVEEAKLQNLIDQLDALYAKIASIEEEIQAIKDATPFGQIAQGVLGLLADILIIEQDEIPPVEAAIQAQQEVIDQLLVEKKDAEDDFALNADVEFSVTQAFPPGSGDYNYSSCLNTSDVVLSSPAAQQSGYTTFDELPNGYLKDQLQNNWEGYTKNFLRQAIRNSRLDSFYNYETGDYKYFDDHKEPSQRFYRDAAFTMPLPMSLDAISLVDDPSSLYVDIKSSYNYYSKYYEQMTIEFAMGDPFEQGFTEDTLALRETWLPSIYDVPLEQSPSNEANPAPFPSDKKFKKFDFERFGNDVISCIKTPSALLSLYGSSRYKQFNVVLDQTNKDFVNKYDSLKSQFPFYNTINIKVDQNKEFASLFNSKGLTLELLKSWISNIFASGKDGGTALAGSSQNKTINIEPNKAAAIGTTEGGDQNFHYWNAHDPSPVFSTYDPEKVAPLCDLGLYSIEPKKLILKIAPAVTTSAAEYFKNKDLIQEKDLGQPTQFGASQSGYYYREFDLNRWLESYLKMFEINNNPLLEGLSTFENKVLNNPIYESSTQLYTSNSAFLQNEDTQQQILTFENLVQFVSEYKALVHSKMRNYWEIMNKANLAYNETLFYRIQKVAIGSKDDPQEKRHAQNIWLVKPNDDSDTDIMKYIDTQVRYDQKYEYTVYAYQIVVGTKYGFQMETAINPTIPFVGYGEAISKYLLTFSNQNYSTFYDKEPSDVFYSVEEDSPIVGRYFGKGVSNRIAKFDVVCEPDVKLIEMPIYTTTTTVSDAPPVAPEVDIVPLNDKENDIKINFYPGSVDQDVEPEVISIQNDDLKFVKIRQSQNRNLLKQEYSNLVGDVDTSLLPPNFYVRPKIRFKSDDFVAEYEIYRMEEPPINSYKAFEGSLLLTINSRNQSSYIDKIEHNKKYYYTFRSIDIHGNISNPSPIYQVEMVENSGVVYPVVSIYKIEQQKKNVKTKSFKKFLKITPSQAQGELIMDNLDQDSMATAYKDSNLSFGLNDGKPVVSTPSNTYNRFKFRIRSKHTGKILDLNVKFDKDQQTVVENEVLTCGDEGYGASKLPEAAIDEKYEVVKEKETPEF